MPSGEGVGGCGGASRLLAQQLCESLKKKKKSAQRDFLYFCRFTTQRAELDGELAADWTAGGRGKLEWRNPY